MVASRLVRTITDRLHQLMGFLSQRDAELSSMRLQMEWQQQSLATGRQMVSAIGYSTRVLSYEVPPGPGTVGRSTGRGAQRLPVDAAGIVAVSLHVARKTAVRGNLVLSLAHGSEGNVLARAEMPYRDLAPGWHDFILDEPLGAVHGDTFLDVAFHSTSDAGPELSLGLEKSRRFGLGGPDARETLALRVWKGLPGTTFAAMVPVGQRIRTERMSASALASSMRYFFGAAEQTVVQQMIKGQSLYGVTSGGRPSLRTVPGIATGILFPSLVKANATAVRIRVTVKGESAAPIHVNLAVVNPHSDADLHSLGREPDRQAGLIEHGHVVSGHDVPANEETVLSAGFARFEEALSIGLFVDRGNSTEAEIEVSGFEVDFEETGPAAGAFTRRLPFGELKSRTSYLFGDPEGARLSQSLGYPVLSISDTENVMQTHAVEGDVAGARATGVLPLGLVRVQARVHTGHAQGPRAEYTLLVVRQEAGSDRPDEFARNLRAFIMEKAATPDFVIASARTVIPTDVETTLRLDLAEPLAAPADLLLVVRSVTDSIGFGWCRWYGLDMTVAPSQAQPHPFPPASTRAR
jgi:hypothetical protein